MARNVYREPATNLKFDEAAASLKEAKVLIEAYVEAVGRLGSVSAPAPWGTVLDGCDPTAMEQEENLRSMDQLLPGIWEKLDHARELLSRCGEEVGAYDAIRARVASMLGFHEQHTSDVMTDRSRWWVDEEMWTLPQLALEALRQLLPAQQAKLTLEENPDVQKYLKGQSSANRKRVLLAVGGMCGTAALLFSFI